MRVLILVPSGETCVHHGHVGVEGLLFAEVRTDVVGNRRAACAQLVAYLAQTGTNVVGYGCQRAVISDCHASIGEAGESRFWQLQPPPARTGGVVVGHHVEQQPDVSRRSRNGARCAKLCGERGVE